MFRRPIPRFAVAAVIAVAALGPATACGNPAVSPSPAAQPSGPVDGSPSAPPVVSPPPPPSTPVAVTTTRPAPARSTRTSAAPRSATSSPTPKSSCQGAIRYEIDVADSADLGRIRSLCFAVGAVLRLKNIGPGQVTVDRTDLASQYYEAGVVDIRLLRAGTVAVRIPEGGEVYTITVVIR